MRTAIIVINYNDSIQTIQYINLIKRYSIINKIIIVDNCSTDDSFENLKKMKNEKIDIVVSKENLGYACGNNLGIKYLEDNYNEKFDYIIISNPDIYIEEDSIIKCIEYMKLNNELAIVAPRIFVGNKPDKRSSWKTRTFITDIINSLGLLQILLYPTYIKTLYQKKDYLKPTLNVDCVSGAFFIIRYDVLKQVGYFDENTFLYYEEDILCKKVKDSGYLINSINTEKCIHYKSQTINKTFNVFKKKNILNESKKYYHYKYNKIKKWKLFVFDILNFLRKGELVLENLFNRILKLCKKNDTRR